MRLISLTVRAHPLRFRAVEESAVLAGSAVRRYGPRVGFESWYAAGKTAVVEDASVFFRHEGSGEALVCIHGFPTSSWDFEPVWPQLVARFEVLASDLIGLGRSEPPEGPLRVAFQASAIESLCLNAGIREAHILAHDLGDTVAQELLARQSEGSQRVAWRSCVFLNGGLFPETHRPRLIQKLLASPLGPIVAKLSTERTFRRNMNRICSDRHPVSAEFLADSWTLLDEGPGRRSLPRLIRYMDERREHRSRWVQPLQDRVVPIRLINGATDPISGRHIAERFRELVPEADLVILDEAGHYPHVEQPEEVVRAFFEFHDRL